MLSNLPVPVQQGIDLRAWTLIDALGRLGPVAVFGVRHDEPSPPPDPTIEVWASSRDAELTARRPADLLEWMRDPGAGPGDAYYSDTAGAELDALIGSFAPGLVVVEELRLHRYLERLDRDRHAVVLDLPSREGDVLRRRADDDPNRAAAVLGRALAARHAAVEGRLLPSVDRVWACSEVDAAILAGRHPSARFEVVPNTVAVDSYPAAPEAAPAPRILFPATFAYPPNETAALTLIEEVLPRIREQEPAAELWLVGSHSAQRLLEAAARPGVVHHGTVDDVRPYLASATVMAVPLTIASGTRYKLLEAFASRLPVVGTALAAEGLDVEDGVHYLRAEDPEAGAAAILRTWSNEGVRRRLTDAAHDLVTQRYSFDASRRAVAASGATHR